MELSVYDRYGQSLAPVSVSDEVFTRPFNEPLVHQIVVAYLAAGRAGTRAQKTRAEVRGGGAKPWRQKGTGRARAGSRRSPIWRGGGVTFAARPQDHRQKVNKKMYRAAIRVIFSELLRQNRLRVTDELTLPEPKTKAMIAQLATWQLTDQKVLLITHAMDPNLVLGSRNLSNVQVCEVAGIDPVSLIRFDQVVVTVPALHHIGEWLK